MHVELDISILVGARMMRDVRVRSGRISMFEGLDPPTCATGTRTGGDPVIPPLKGISHSKQQSELLNRVRQLEPDLLGLWRGYGEEGDGVVRDLVGMVARVGMRVRVLR